MNLFEEAKADQAAKADKQEAQRALAELQQRLAPLPSVKRGHDIDDDCAYERVAERRMEAMYWGCDPCDY